MAVGLSEPGQLLPVNGIELATAAAGLKDAGCDDMLLVQIAPGASVAGVFTNNAYCAAPVTLCREHLAATRASRALLINAGNANAGTGCQGRANALALCADVAGQLNAAENEILPFSTGVIGAQLPLQAMRACLPEMVRQLAADRWSEAAAAIMTTDTLPKAVSASCEIDGKPVTITGISKGSGMIHPNMATMLAFVATDAAVQDDALQQLLKTQTDRTFNCITVDGDTSTNDSCIYIATGKAGNSPLHPGHADWSLFSAALESVALQLAHAIVRDGEGATRFIEIEVKGGPDDGYCREVGLTVAHSPLVKTAFFAGDPNLGRILMAIGRSRVDNLDMQQVSLRLADLPVVSHGEPDAGYDEQRAFDIMAAEDIQMRISLGDGAGAATVWTTDLSYEYVKINAEYRS